MAWEVDTDHLLMGVPMLLAAVGMLAMAAVIFIRRPFGRVNRSFACFLVVLAVDRICFSLNGDPASLWGRLRPYASNALPFVSLYVAYQLLCCYRVAWVRRLPGWAVLGVLGGLAATCDVLYGLDHAWVLQKLPNGNYSNGPFGYLSEIGMLMWSLVACLLAFALRGNRLPLSQRSLGQAIASFVLVPAYWCSFYLLGNLVGAASGRGSWYDLLDLAHPDNLLDQLFVWSAWIVSLLPVLLVKSKDADVRLEGRRIARLVLVAMATGLVTGAAMAFHESGEKDLLYVPHFVAYGLAQLAAVALLAGPVLRDQILDMDTRIHATIRNGMVGAVLGGLVLAVVEVATNILGNLVGFGLGSLGLLVLLFAVAPVKVLCDNLVQRPRRAASACARWVPTTVRNCTASKPRLPGPMGR